MRDTGRKHRSLRLGLILTLGVMIAAASVLAFPVNAQEIRLGYVLWESEIASTHVVGAVIEDKLGHDVELISVDAGPMWTGIAQGDFDAIVAAWLPGTHHSYYSEVWDQVVDLGPNLEGAAIGLVVPSYVTIDSVEELDDHANEFDRRIVGIDPGAGLMQATEEAIDAYNIQRLSLIDGSDATMTAALSNAIRRNEWVVVTGWTPHWKFAEWDLKYLEDPRGVFGGAERIHTIVTPELRSKAPDVFEFLDRFYWTNAQMGEVMLDIKDGADPWDAARDWIAANEDIVNHWLP